MLKSERRGRASQPTVDPTEMRQTLLKYHEAANYGTETSLKLQRKGMTCYRIYELSLNFHNPRANNVRFSPAFWYLIRS